MINDNEDKPYHLPMINDNEDKLLPPAYDQR